MDFRTLLKELDNIAVGDDSKYNITSKDISNVSQLGQQDTNAAPVSSPQDQSNKQNLTKKLYDLITQLWQLTQQSIEQPQSQSESIGRIEYALLESFGILMEDEITTRRNQIMYDINDTIKQLGSYTSDPAVAMAIKKAQQAMTYKPSQVSIPNQTAASTAQTGASASKTGVNTGSSAKQKAMTKPVSAKPDEKVKQVQQALLNKNYWVGTKGTDGVLGKDTKAGILDFQRKNGLEPTGTITDELLSALGIGTNSPASGSTNQATGGSNKLKSNIISTIEKFDPEKIKLIQQYLNRPVTKDGQQPINVDGKVSEYMASLINNNEYYQEYLTRVLADLERGSLKPSGTSASSVPSQKQPPTSDYSPFAAAMGSSQQATNAPTASSTKEKPTGGSAPSELKNDIKVRMDAILQKLNKQ